MISINPPYFFNIRMYYCRNSRKIEVYKTKLMPAISLHCILEVNT